jgi:hypothetical protein
MFTIFSQPDNPDHPFSDKDDPTELAKVAHIYDAHLLMTSSYKETSGRVLVSIRDENGELTSLALEEEKAAYQVGSFEEAVAKVHAEFGTVSVTATGADKCLFLRRTDEGLIIVAHYWVAKQGRKTLKLVRILGENEFRRWTNPKHYQWPPGEIIGHA